MTVNDIVAELKPLGRDSYKKVMVAHGAREPFFGVKIEDLKKIQKRIKKDYQLALDLFDTGISDAMYLAGLIADDEQMTKKDLQHWAEKAYFPLISESTVAWVAAEGKHGREMALKWIDSKKENVASSGWATLSCLTAIADDADLDFSELKQLLQRVVKTIHQQPNRVRYTMNSFVIHVGSYVKTLTNAAVEAAKRIGPVSVDMGGTACKVPSAVEYIKKIEARGAIGKKRKTVKC
ncbi:MAG TPA: DNA alkylation repair protein [Gemmataceae bacterium]|nr:DNA alkylation repair protein [Gemmataceae bacterium]